jgi:hypothetical protein
MWVERSLLILRIALGALTVAFVSPVAVNFATAKPPQWLEPYSGWSWVVAICCVFLIIILELLKDRWSTTSISVHRPNPRNVALALQRVERYVGERQSGSLTQFARLALELDEKPLAVLPPSNLVGRIGGREFKVSTKLEILDLFLEMTESMLILGAPGSGKTTQLLDLAAGLVEKARASGSTEGPAIPVVVDLAGWSTGRNRSLIPWRRRTKQDFAKWLLRAIENRFSVPKKVGQKWLEDNNLTLLLDGLDEVSPNDRARCVAAINDLQEKHGISRLAVSCREIDYELTGSRLKMQGALLIRPLSERQVWAFLDAVSPHLAGVGDALQADHELWELLTTPLMLNIMVLAQNHPDWEALGRARTPLQRRRALFDAYVVEVLARRRSGEVSEPRQTLRAVRTLAQATVLSNTGVTIPTSSVYRTSSHRVSVALSNSGSFVDRFRPLMQVQPEMVGFWIYLPTFSIGTIPPTAFMALNFGYIGGLMPGILCLALLWLWTPRRLPRCMALADRARLARYLGYLGLAVFTILSFPVALTNLDHLEFLALTLFVCGLVSGTTMGFCVRLYDWILPGHSLFDIAERFTLVQLLGYSGIMFFVPLIFGGSSPRGPKIMVGWLIAASIGIVLGMLIEHLTSGNMTRFALLINGNQPPWAAPFLRFAADRSLLTYANKEFRFVHLLIRDHLSECDAERLAAEVSSRRTELPM